MDWISNMFSTSWGRSAIHRDTAATTTTTTATNGDDPKWLSIEVIDEQKKTSKAIQQQQDNEQQSIGQSEYNFSVDSLPMPAGEMDMFILPTVIPNTVGGRDDRHHQDRVMVRSSPPRPQQHGRHIYQP